MITNGKVLAWSEPVEKAYANAVDRIIVNIARHLKSGKAIHTAKWETQKLSEMGQLTAENARIIRDALRQMPKDMKDALDDTAKESLRLVDEAIEEAIRTGAIERSPISSTQGVIDELSQQALDQMNLVNTTMLESSQKAYLKCVNDTVRWETSMLSEQQTQTTLETLNDATTAVLSGGETRTLALRRAIKELNAAGLYGFVDKRGRHWSPEAYVNMCMRTTVHNVAVRSVRARQEDYGSSIFQCSYHPASRPEHYPFQNKFYSWDGTSGTFTDGMGGKHQYEPVTVTGYGTAAGLFGINCGHFPLPQIPGVTVPSDPDMQSAETDARQYKESQEQRQLEWNIRLSKRLEEAYKAAGDDVGAAEAGMRTKLEQAQMREFIDRTGRVRRYDREQISGYGPDKLVRPKRTAPKKVTPPAPKPVEPKKPETEEYTFLKEVMKVNKVEYLKPEKYRKAPTEEEIIRTVGGGDMTTGSCSSLALAYAGNKAGLKVLDFRGGSSLRAFSRTSNIIRIVDMLGGRTVKNGNDFKGALELLKDVVEGHEYYLSTGQHVAVVKKEDGHYQYLELQSPKDNGWHRLTNDVLKKRFGCKKSHRIAGEKLEASSQLFDLGNAKGNDEFADLLGYINTAADKQQKGERGSVK